MICPGPVVSNLLRVAATENAGEVRTSRAAAMLTQKGSQFWICGLCAPSQVLHKTGNTELTLGTGKFKMLTTDLNFPAPWTDLAKTLFDFWPKFRNLNLNEEVCLIGNRPQKFNEDWAPSANRMPTERCAHLSLVAVAHGLSEVQYMYSRTWSNCPLLS